MRPDLFPFLTGLLFIIFVIVEIFKEGNDPGDSPPAPRPPARPAPNGPPPARPAPPPPRRPRTWDDVKPRRASPAYRVVILDPSFRALTETACPCVENLGKYAIFNSEGEYYTIDTSDYRSPFYGPSWDIILDALTGEKAVEGKITAKITAPRGSFNGYEVTIRGVKAFLPRSESGPYSSPEKDPSGTELMVKPFLLYPAGRLKGKLLVQYAPPEEGSGKGGNNAKPLPHP